MEEAPISSRELTEFTNNVEATMEGTVRRMRHMLTATDRQMELIQSSPAAGSILSAESAALARGSSGIPLQQLQAPASGSDADASQHRNTSPGRRRKATIASAADDMERGKATYKQIHQVVRPRV